MAQDAPERALKNTFAPSVENEHLSVHYVILGLKTAMLRSRELPLEVREAVTAELRRRWDGQVCGSAAPAVRPRVPAPS